MAIAVRSRARLPPARLPPAATASSAPLDIDGSSLYPSIRIYGLTERAADSRPSLRPGRRDARPAAAAGRGARADGDRALRRAAAAAVHRQPASQGAGRRGWVTSRAEGTSRLYTMAREAARRADAPAVAARARTGGRLACARRRITAGCRACSPSAGRSRRSSSRRRPGSGTACARSCSARSSTCRRCSGCWTIAGSSAISAPAPARSRRPSRRLSRASSPSTTPRRCCRRRSGGCTRLANVELRRGDLEDLPIDDEALDAATLMLVLPYLPQPARVLREAARVLKPGGRLLVADMLPHDREAYRQQMGHVRLGILRGADLGAARGRRLRRACTCTRCRPIRARRVRPCSLPSPAAATHARATS